MKFSALARFLAGILWIPVLLFTLRANAQDATTDVLRVTIHVVQRGETLFRIAQDYGTTYTELAQLNQLADPDDIDVGQRLLVPSDGADSSPLITHVVQPGETLETIAGLYGLAAGDLELMNNLADANVAVGQTVLITGVSVVAAVPEASAPEPEAPSETATVLHTVRTGETLFRIAQSYGVTVADVVSANGLTDADIIYAGQALVIPGVVPPQLAAELPAPVTSFSVLPLILIEGQSAEFRINASTPITVAGTFLDRALTAVYESDNTDAIVMVGVPVGTAAGIYPVQFVVSSAGGASPLSANVQVVSGGYAQERDIELVGDASVLLDPVVEQAEVNVLRSIMTPINPARFFSGTFGLPAAATITSAFGNVRSYNGGSALRTHFGVDFGGAPGTPILAPAAGRVVMVDTLTVRGLATIIDHGWGVYTGYWHQSQSYVQVGEDVQAGQTIGLIGASGRVSGPHLHWEMWVEGVPVDPLQWTVLAFG